MGRTYGFLSTNSYPELLRKHKALGDIAITDSEIATVEQWAKNLDAITIKQYQTTDAKEQEEKVNAFPVQSLTSALRLSLKKKILPRCLRMRLLSSMYIMPSI